MDKARVLITNLLAIDKDIILLTQEDFVIDSEGNRIDLSEGIEIGVFQENFNEDGIQDNLVADGIVISRPEGCTETRAKWFLHLKHAFRVYSRYKRLVLNNE